MTKTITQVVSDRISSISSAVNESVIEALVNRELEKRSNAIVQGFDRLDNLNKEFRKIRPDIQALFDEDGVETTPASWSKSKLEERSKAKSNIDKLENALNLAIEQGEMQKLYDLLK